MTQSKCIRNKSAPPSFSTGPLLSLSQFGFYVRPWREWKAAMALPLPDPQFVLRGTGAPVNTLHFCCRNQEQDKPLLFSGSANGAVHVWNLRTRRTESVLEGHGGASVLWVQTLNSRDALISQGHDLRVCMWDLAEGRSVVTDSILTESVGFCQCSLLDREGGHWLLAVPGADMAAVRVLDLPSKTPVCTLKPDANLGMPMCLKLWQPDSGSSPLLWAGYEDGSVSLWNLSERSLLSRLACHAEPIMSLDFDPGKLRGVSGSSEKAINSWTLDGQQSLKLQDSVELVNPGISHLCIREDRRILATAGWNHRIRLLGWKKLKPLAVLQYHTDVVQFVAFSDHDVPNKRLMAAGSKDQRISFWSVYNQI
ncbi:guanine nucleotide-binding protein subunit beta-like protein 1 isoform X1 [Acipenser oxyrinchus oxyrinchus]|uniref:Guanine nucleotide-binding protein subunit beta-like protein 1 isoform X1 n=1 Tax=Acipenser oxyrinchus oxyrinchus TaxID=40147 RepID=A0AAD8CTQ5_ACIOX|nr:guanine nucleotide-binding protein subunit beta-like protein 1 isoform X1 [Acipenser oxyrinchus oxyrinchus]